MHTPCLSSTPATLEPSCRPDHISVASSHRRAWRFGTRPLCGCALMGNTARVLSRNVHVRVCCCPYASVHRSTHGGEQGGQIEIRRLNMKDIWNRDFGSASSHGTPDVVVWCPLLHDMSAGQFTKQAQSGFIFPDWRPEVCKGTREPNWTRGVWGCRFGHKLVNTTEGLILLRHLLNWASLQDHSQLPIDLFRANCFNSDHSLTEYWQGQISLGCRLHPNGDSLADRTLDSDHFGHCLLQECSSVKLPDKPWHNSSEAEQKEAFPMNFSQCMSNGIHRLILMQRPMRLQITSQLNKDISRDATKTNHLPYLPIQLYLLIRPKEQRMSGLLACEREPNASDVYSCSGRNVERRVSTRSLKCDLLTQTRSCRKVQMLPGHVNNRRKRNLDKVNPSITMSACACRHTRRRDGRFHLHCLLLVGLSLPATPSAHAPAPAPRALAVEGSGRVAVASAAPLRLQSRRQAAPDTSHFERRVCLIVCK
ncbi:unnamed protein product [Protopolystoma xenopodis]|uniref:Uncharacterized protein n=1 Tax=Protopolystoma xenopodis TaxID=117903 RepID=A0A3S5A4V1_9PLAT|nr:unnamed protein product [Protopolystoma xenopodis]